MTDPIHNDFINELSALVLQGQLPKADADLYIRAVSERWPATAVFDRSILAAIKSHYPQETSLVEAMALWDGISGHR
ncbi:hypothetical protein LCGC14_1168050 [marine sediment metagenome]|uniref:Uncharacterized protein n=1 Tax=marine sediment metagenome TaxID=412755 RepID=A0A0F9PW48_9ZZZZ